MGCQDYCKKPRRRKNSRVYRLAEEINPRAPFFGGNSNTIPSFFLASLKIMRKFVALSLGLLMINIGQMRVMDLSSWLAGLSMGGMISLWIIYIIAHDKLDDNDIFK